MSSRRWLAPWLSLCLASAALAEDTTLCRKGWEASQDKQDEVALQLYRECLEKGELSPANTALMERNVGALLYGQGKFGPAAEAFTRGIAARPPDVWRYHLNRAWAWFRAGEARKALDDFDETLALEPQDQGALYGRGLTLERLGREFEAYAAFERAGALAPSDDDDQVREQLQEYERFGLDRSASYRGDGFGALGGSYRVGAPVRAAKLGVISESKASCLVPGDSAADESPRADAESLRSYGRFAFPGGRVEVVFPQLDGVETLDVRVHLDDLSRGVRDDYLTFSAGGEPRAAVLVTTLAKRMRSSFEVHRAILDQVEELGAAFPPGDLVIRDLDGPWGAIVELLARNRAGEGACFPTSAYVRAPEGAPTLGVTRFVHRGELLVEIALVVRIPEELPLEQRAEHARARMDELMGAVTIRD